MSPADYNFRKRKICIEVEHINGYYTRFINIYILESRKFFLLNERVVNSLGFAGQEAELKLLGY